MIWENCKLEVLYYSNDVADTNWPCTVRIDDGSILVEYDNDGLCQYVGENDGSDHFELIMKEGGIGRATLHRVPGTAVLEGSWVEDGERGMWRILLPE